MKKTVSIIIRTKNEERWIGHCLKRIHEQDFQDFEIVLVDNCSDDHTVEIAKRFLVDKILSISDFIPGKAINDGIRQSIGNFIVCVSAHCVPKERNWLSKLLSNFDNQTAIAGVYGRQLPVSYTDPIDKRDLLLVFGRAKRV